MQNKFKRLTAIPAFMLMLGGAVSTQAQMVTPGEFAVNQNGAATYTIPIQVPAGVGGMQPKLALVYNSQAGNGLMGMGWGLTGLSSITRCPQTRAQDGSSWVGGISYKNTDRFCLDGQRLVNVWMNYGPLGDYGADQTYYSTEVSTFSRIQSFGAQGTAPYAGPSYFIVKTKSGLTMEYGNTVDSKVLAVGKDAVRVWALNKVMDAKGNFMTVTYNAPDPVGGQHYPLRVDYTGNDGVTPKLVANRSVTFEYDPDPANGGKPKQRLDGGVVYSGGSVETLGVRLTKIVIGRAGVDGSYYTVDYARWPEPRFEDTDPFQSVQQGYATGPSRVEKVTQCDAVKHCLAAIKFSVPAAGSDYYIKPVSFEGPVALNGLVGNVLRASNGAADVVLADFNGDGKADILAWNDDFTKNKLFFSVGVGRFSEANNFNIKTESLAHSNGLTGVEVGDFNGDGRSDILRWSTTAANNAVFLSNKDGSFTKWPFGLVGVNIRSARYMEKFWKRDIDFSIGDFNGDGRSDIIVWNNEPTTPLSATATVYFSTNLQAVDPTLVAGPVQSGDKINQRTCHQTARLVGDFNGDGRTDVMVTCGTTGLYLSRGGQGVFDWNALPVLFESDSSRYSNSDTDEKNQVLSSLVDINGDGLLDVLRTGLIDHAHMASGSEAYLQTGGAQFVRIGPLSTFSFFYRKGVFPGMRAGSTSWITYDYLPCEIFCIMRSSFPPPLVALTLEYGVVSGDFDGDGLVDFYEWSKRPAVGVFPYQKMNLLNLTRPVLSRRVWPGDSGQTNREYGAMPYRLYPGVDIMGATASVGTEQVYSADFDGDGRSDILRLDDDKTRNAVFLSKSSLPIGGVQTISTGLDGSIPIASIVYAPLSQVLGTRYTKTQTVGDLEYHVVTPAMPVVTEVTASNGAGGVRTMSYSYDSAIVNRYGRGWMGFNWVQKTDGTTGLTETNYYNPYFPGTGQLVGTYKGTDAVDGVNNLGTSAFIFGWGSVHRACANISICRDGRGYYISSHGTYFSGHRDVTALGAVGVAMPGMELVTTMDSWGNLINSTETTMGADGPSTGHVKTTINKYSPGDIDNWRPGRLLRSTTTVTAP